MNLIEKKNHNALVSGYLREEFKETPEVVAKLINLFSSGEFNLLDVFVCDIFV